MPVYRYQAIDDQGRSINGTMSAEDELTLERKLKSAGLWLLETVVEGARPANAAQSGSGRLSGKKKRRALIDFCTMMAFQTKVGIPLVHALEVIAQQYENPKFRSVVGGLQRQMEGGQRFYEALGNYPRVFSTEFVGVVRAGEMSSKLPETFRDLKKYLEWMDGVIRDIRQATLYPVIVLSVISSFVLFLFTFVIPKFAKLLNQLNVPLPMVTQFTFAVSEFAKRTWWLWLLVIIGSTVGIQLGRRLSRPFALGVDQVKLKLPIFGELNQMIAISRFARNFVMLYRAGIPVLSSLELCQGLVGNLVIAEAVASMQEDVKGGSTISDAMRKNELFPPMLQRMVVMGENTGNLDTSLEEVADYYNQIIPERIKKMLTLLEPALMLFLIGVVLIVALSIYLPLISVMGSIR